MKGRVKDMWKMGRTEIPWLVAMEGALPPDRVITVMEQDETTVRWYAPVLPATRYYYVSKDCFEEIWDENKRDSE